jgi:glycine cleavage system transcriptional repressor
MNEIVITAVGSDRPGIVSALTRALLDLGGNLEDARAALLRGSFAVVLVVALPDGVAEVEVESALQPVSKELGLGLWIGRADPPATAGVGERCVISVYGADHPGIVHGFSAAMSDLGVNIVDLSSRVVGDPPVYVLGIAAELPVGLDPAALEATLRKTADSHRVEFALTRDSDEVI